MSARPRFSCALVTGASGGLGRALAQVLAPRCERIVLVARRESALSELAAELGERAVPLVLDLARPDPAARLLAALREADVAPEEVDLLINNAATTVFGPLVETPLERLQVAQRVNLAAPLELMHQFGGLMRTAGRGTLVSVASVAAFGTGPLMSAYYAEKNWLRVLSLSLDAELTPHGVRVLTVCPGPFKSAFHATAGMPSAAAAASRLPAAADVARRILRAIERGERLVPIGPAAGIWALLAPRLPWRLSRWIMARLQAARLDDRRG